MSYIDATAGELQAAFAVKKPDEACRLLVEGCEDEITVAAVLQHGWRSRWIDPETPGFFRFLVLTCAVVASAHENVVSQDFGFNLSRFLGTERTFGLRGGLPSMWRALVDWCNARRAGGMSIREIRLPPKSVGAHLGLTNAIAFPHWRDVLRLRQDLERSATARKRLTPESVAIALCGLVTSERRYRDPLVKAAGAFREMYDRRRTLLELHPFWTVVLHASKLTRLQHSSIAVVVRAELVQAAFASGTKLRVAMIARSGEEISTTWTAFTAAVGLVEDHLLDWGGGAASRLKQWFREGAVPFIAERFGVWVTTNAFPDGMHRVRYLIRDDLSMQVPLELKRLLESAGPGWQLLGPVEGHHAGAVHRALGIAFDKAPLQSQLRVVDGVRTAVGWLGRCSVLPNVARLGDGVVTLVPSLGSNQVVVEARLISGGLVELDASAPLAGAYRLRLEEPAQDVGAVAIEVPVRFVPHAPLHDEIRPVAARWKPIEEMEGVTGRRASGGKFELEGSLAPDVNNRFDDLLEVIYAGGRGGWGEREIVDMVRDLCPGPNSWDVLRSLQEAAWLDRYAASGWRAFAWRLSPPHLVRVQTKGGNILVLRGSACTNVRERFFSTARALGAMVGERAAAGPFSTTTCFAGSVDTDALELELGWPVVEHSYPHARRAPMCWPHERRSLAGFIKHREWSWDLSAFVPPDNLTRDVELNWFRRSDMDRHDVYQVRRGSLEFVSSSRTVALLEAHRLRNAPLFVGTSQEILRRGREGYLPLPLARAIAVSALITPGPVKRDGAWTYAYPTGASSSALESVLGGCVSMTELNKPQVQTSLAAEAQGLARHRQDRWARGLLA